MGESALSSKTKEPLSKLIETAELAGGLVKVRHRLRTCVTGHFRGNVEGDGNKTETPKFFKIRNSGTGARKKAGK